MSGDLPARLRRARLIAAREFRERVAQRAYLIALVVGAVLAAAVVLLPSILGNNDKTGSGGSRQVVSTFVAGSPAAVHQELAFLGRSTALVRGAPIRFEQATSAKAVRDAVRDSDRPLGLLIAGDALDPSATVITRQDGGGELSDQVSQAVDAAATLARLQLAKADAGVVLAPARIRGEEVSGSGPTSEAAAVVSVLGLLLYMGGLLLTTSYATGVVSDRTNHVTERLLTATKPFEHLAGKMLGVGASGLLQFGVWLLAAVLASAFGGHGTAFDHVPVRVLAFFPVALILTYVMFASLAAVLVLPVRKSEDVGGAIAPATIMQIFSFSAATTIIAPGSSVSSFVHTMSLIPFFSPLLLLARLAGSAVPVGELVLGIVGPLVVSAVLLRLVAPAYARYAIEAPGGKGLKTAFALLRR